MSNPIAYTYEAAHHCPVCTIARFGVDGSGFPSESATDNEGNPLGAVFSWDEWFNVGACIDVMSCDTCEGEIDRYEPYDLIEKEAQKDGRDAGIAAGSWVIDGNTSEETARTILRGLEDGDPAIIGEFPPYAPLSGEWADGPTPASVLDAYGMTEDDPAASEVIDVWESAWYDGYLDEVERSAHAMLPDQDTATA